MYYERYGLLHASDHLLDPSSWSLDSFWVQSPQFGFATWFAPLAVQIAAVGDLGTIQGGVRGAQGHNGSGGTGGSGTTSGTSPSPTVITTAGSGLVINLVWDPSVGSAPSGFTSDVIAAAQFLESQIATAATININVGYGEVGGTSLAFGALGESETNIVSVNYSSLVAALAATASTDATDASLLASLPATSPVNGLYWITTAQAKALGLMQATGSTADGNIGFASSSYFTYGDTNTSGTVAPNTYDFFSTVVHEITEVMGRLLLVGDVISPGTGAGYSLMDLMHYSAPGVRDFTQSTPGYLSVDGGATNLGAFNTTAGGDAGDWANSVTNDAFDAFANPGVLEAVSNNDLTALDAIGWNLTNTPTPTPSPTPPSGVTFAPVTSSLSRLTGSSGLNGGRPIASITQVGGVAGDTFSYQLGGPNASSFILALSGGVEVLEASSSGLPGAAGGRLYELTATATDTTLGVSSAPDTLNLVVASAASETISLASLGGISNSAPTFVYGLAGNDTVSGAGMSGAIFFDGGAGADIMTGGSGHNIYEYASTSDSTTRSMDFISNFKVNMDTLDFTGLGTRFSSVSQLNGSASSIAGHSIGWQAVNGNTFVYVNTGSRSESLTSVNMKIELAGNVQLTAANIAHV